MTPKTTRRKFLVTSVAIASDIVGCGALKQNLTSAQQERVREAAMPERELGNTGVRVPILGLGGAGQTPLSWEGHEREAVAIIPSGGTG